MNVAAQLKKIGLVTSLLLFSSYSFSQTASSPTLPSSSPVQNKGSDKVDLKKLEDKYWAAKDDEYGVIQNRTFAKSGKFYLSLVYGPLINDPYAKARASGGMLGYYLSEDFGVELDYLNYNASQSETVTAYANLPGNATPNYNLIKSSKAISLSYTPFYAKMAFMNKAILYFDMGFTFGVGQTDYEIQKVDKDGGGTKTGVAAMSAVSVSYDIHSSLLFRLRRFIFDFCDNSLLPRH